MLLGVLATHFAAMAQQYQHGLICDTMRYHISMREHLFWNDINMSHQDEPQELTHLSADGEARMVDISMKEATHRSAAASAIVQLTAKAFTALQRGELKKGDALAVARIAGIMAAKDTSRIIPLCHPIPLSSIEVTFQLDENTSQVMAHSVVSTYARTGVEMEALTAVSAAALALYDMVKSVDKGCIIQEIALISKTGGKSGDYQRTSLS